MGRRGRLTAAYPGRVPWSAAFSASTSSTDGQTNRPQSRLLAWLIYQAVGREDPVRCHATTLEHEQISGVGIALQMPLHQQGQVPHALKHIRVARGTPNSHARRDRDLRSARSVTLSKAEDATLETLPRRPRTNSTTIAVSTPGRAISPGASQTVADTNVTSSRATMAS